MKMISIQQNIDFNLHFKHLIQQRNDHMKSWFVVPKPHSDSEWCNCSTDLHPMRDEHHYLIHAVG
jgi:hypothetical protein